MSNIVWKVLMGCTERKCGDSKFQTVFASTLRAVPDDDKIHENWEGKSLVNFSNGVQLDDLQKWKDDPFVVDIPPNFQYDPYWLQFDGMNFYYFCRRMFENEQSIFIEKQLLVQVVIMFLEAIEISERPAPN